MKSRIIFFVSFMVLLFSISYTFAENTSNLYIRPHLKVNPYAINIEEGSTIPVPAVSFLYRDRTQDVTNQCTWKPLNPAVAVVENGVIKGIGPGTTQIEVLGPFNPNGKVNTLLDITVTEKQDSIEVNPFEVWVEVGKTHAYKLMLYYVGGRVENITKKAYAVSGNPSIAVVNKGIKGIAPGDTWMDYSYNGIGSRVHVHVIPRLNRLETVKSVTLAVGQDYVADIYALYASGQKGIVVPFCTYTSSNPAVATIDEQGWIWAKSPGVAIMTASLASKKVRYKVVVK